MLGVGCGLVGGGAYSRYYANEIYNDDLNKPMTFEETHERTERTVGANILNFFSIPIMIAGTVIGTIGTVKTVKYYKKRKLDFSLRTETNYVKLDLVYKW